MQVRVAACLRVWKATRAGVHTPSPLTDIQNRDGAVQSEPSAAPGGLEQSWDSLKFFSMNQRGNLHSPAQPTSIPEDQSPSASAAFSPHASSAAGVPPSPNSSSGIPKSLRASAVGGAALFGDAAFTIPELPTGRELTLHLKSTWGLGHYIGLAGECVNSALVGTIDA